jgi:hypothetical protein
MEVLGLRSLAPTLPLDEDGVAGSDPIQVLDIQGLEPVKAAITTSLYGAFDGEAYVGANVGKRNIVLTIGLNPDWKIQTPEELRQLLYNYFMPKLLVELRFHSDIYPTVRIEGYVEDVKPNIFSKTPQMQVSIICPRPDFIAVAPSIFTGLTNDGSALTEIDYAGSVSTGILLKINQAVGSPGEATIQVNLTGEGAPQTFLAKGNITPDVRWEMSSIMGAKYVRSVTLATAAITNYLNDVAVDAVWPRLYPGVNNLAVLTAVVGQNWELSYYTRFGGL